MKLKYLLLLTSACFHLEFAVAGIWDGTEAFQAPIIKPVKLNGAKRIILNLECKSLLRGTPAEATTPLPLRRGKTVDYPKESKKVGKHTQRLDDVFLDISDASRDSEIATTIAEGMKGASKKEIVEKIESFRNAKRKRVSLAEFLPNFIAKEMGVSPDCEGPNCFNTAMRFHGFEKVSVETYDYEMVGTLRDKYTALKDEDELKFGDLVIFWVGNKELGYQGNIRHAAVYMGNGIVLHKASMKEGDPITFENLENVLKYYRDVKFKDEGMEHFVTFHRLQ